MAAQTACDLLRKSSVSEGTYKHQAEFWEATDGLRSLIGVYGEPNYSFTYVRLLTALQGQYSGIGNYSRTDALLLCDEFNFNEANTGQGLNVNSGRYADPTPGPSDDIAALLSILCGKSPLKKPFNLATAQTEWKAGNLDGYDCEVGSLYMQLATFPSPLTRKWWWNERLTALNQAYTTKADEKWKKLEIAGTICGKEWMLHGGGVSSSYAAKVKKAATQLRSAGFILVKCSD